MSEVCTTIYTLIVAGGHVWCVYTRRRIVKVFLLVVLYNKTFELQNMSQNNFIADNTEIQTITLNSWYFDFDKISAE